MKNLLSIKTALRTPVKTILTILLLAATSYMLFFNIAEYTVMSREFERTAGYYKGVGAVEAKAIRPFPLYPAGRYSTATLAGTDAWLYTDDRIGHNPYSYDQTILNSWKYETISQSDIDAISNLPYVTSVSVRYMTAGVSPDLKRSDLMRSDLKYKNFNYTARFVAEATFDHNQFLSYFGAGGHNAPEPPPELIKEDDEGLFGSNKTLSMPEADWRARAMFFKDADLLAGDSAWFTRYNNQRDGRYDFPVEAFAFAKGYPDDYTLGYFNASVPERYSAILHLGESYYDDVYSYDFLESLVPGERYLIIGRLDPVPATQMTDGSMRKLPNPVLSDPSTIGWWPQVYPLKDLPENYLELDEFAPLREMIEITNTDLHTFDVVYADDMSSIMRFAEGSMAIKEGRMLNDADSEQQSNVCVMSQYFMRQNSLRIGDTIRLQLGDKLFEQNSAVGAVASVRERYADTFTDEIEFEIVGAYADTDSLRERDKNQNWTYSNNTIFVPLTFLPCEVPQDHAVKPGEFSFVVENAKDITPFMDEPAFTIQAVLGLNLLFSDGGWPAVEAQLSRSDALAVIKLVLFSLSVFLSICLTVYLFIMRKRKEYAIMRALGTPRRRSAKSMYIPLGLISLIALAAGYILAYANAGKAIERSLSAYYTFGVEVNASIPAAVTVLCLACEVTALALVTAFGLWRVGVRPPLELLQVRAAETVQRDPARRAAIQYVANAAELSVNREVFSKPDAVLFAGNRPGFFRSFGFVVRYIAHHIRRSAVKSLLSADLAILLLGTVGQLTLIRGTYRNALANIGVKAHITNGLKLRDAISVAESKYIRTPSKDGGYTFLSAPYFENRVQTLTCNGHNVSVVMTNDLDRYSNGELAIEYLDGYDDSSMSLINSPDNNICLLSERFMEENEIELGDTVRFSSGSLRFRLSMLFTSESKDGEEDKLTPEQEAQIDELVAGSSVYYTVAGRIISETESGLVYIPINTSINVINNWLEAKITLGDPGKITAIREIIGAEEYASVKATWEQQMVLPYIEYTLASPDYADDFRLFVKREIVHSIGSSRTVSLVIDTAEADSMSRTLTLLDGLYPIAIAAAAILGGLFPGLIVMQSDREASIMRVLGTTKKRARAMLVSEQAALFSCGLLLAAAALLVIHGVVLAAYKSQLLSYTALHLAACSTGALICAVIITRRRPLELLQVKE